MDPLRNIKLKKGKITRKRVKYLKRQKDGKIRIVDVAFGVSVFFWNKFKNYSKIYEIKLNKYNLVL